MCMVFGTAFVCYHEALTDKEHPKSDKRRPKFTEPCRGIWLEPPVHADRLKEASPNIPTKYGLMCKYSCILASKKATILPLEIFYGYCDRCRAAGEKENWGQENFWRIQHIASQGIDFTQHSGRHDGGCQNLNLDQALGSDGMGLLGWQTIINEACRQPFREFWLANHGKNGRRREAK